MSLGCQPCILPPQFLLIFSENLQMETQAAAGLPLGNKAVSLDLSCFIAMAQIPHIWMCSWIFQVAYFMAGKHVHSRSCNRNAGFKIILMVVFWSCFKCCLHTVQMYFFWQLCENLYSTPHRAASPGPWTESVPMIALELIMGGWFSGHMWKAWMTNVSFLQERSVNKKISWNWNGSNLLKPWLCIVHKLQQATWDFRISLEAVI